MEYTIENANRYIKENQKNINSKYRLKIHMIPPIGWMNDPNGLIKIDDKYHLFYQYYPYDSKWGPMHWGHFLSYDLIKYQNLNVALAPNNQNEESGCFSGGAILVNNNLKLIYTKHYENQNYKKEEIFSASSSDYINFRKDEISLFNNNDLPNYISRNDFRDPCPRYINGNYYLFLGGKNINTNKGLIIVLKSSSLQNFKYDFSIGPFDQLGDMAECPSYGHIDGKDFVIVSGCNVKERENSFKNIHSSVFIVGKIDFENKKMSVEKIQEIDKGDSFYAPIFITNEENVMIGWMEMWGKTYPTDILKHGWAGAFSIPRKITYKNGQIYQYPIDAIKKYYNQTYLYQDGLEVNLCSDISISFQGNFTIVFKSWNGDFKIEGREYIYLDTSNSNNLNGCIRHTSNKYQQGNLRIILDKSSIEIFVNEGLETISSRIYLDENYHLDIKGNIKIIVNNLKI